MFVKKKQIVWVILLTFLFGFIPCSSIKVSASDDINIISSTNITVSTAKAWAKSKGATNTFIALADLYWKYARSHGNVNPAVAYVQAAKETGYGKFGGVINETYHNPCGMKVAAGGRDDDPNAHMKFENWDKGVQAHIDHLALYAGASGYPKKGNTNDPRHFASIVRKATTVKALGTNWAPSSSYGIEILNLYRDLEKCEVVGKMIGTIDEPTGNITTDTVLVRGWALNTSGVSSIKIYIDDVLKSTVNVGDSRPDVKKVYPTYNNADKSGYSSKINISDLSNGTKTLKVEQIGKDGSKNILTRSITVNRVLSRMYIDTPTYNSTIKGNSMTVSGWAVNKEEIKAINIYVNGVKKATTTANLSRPDVKKVYPEFANASTSGFSEKISLSDIAGGKNTIKVEQVTVSNKTDSIETVVNINKPKPRTYIDAPFYGTTIKGNSLIVKGWSVSNEGIKAINIYVDGVLKKTTTANLLRPDVQKVYPEYKDASKSGFSEKIDISDISNGIKTVKVEQVSNAGKTSEQVKINVVKPRPIICIDTPVSGRSVGGSSLTVSGWAISNTAIKSINIYVDGVLKKTTTKLLSRPDVQKAYPNYLNSDKSGFSENIDISNVVAGQRIIKVEQVASDGSKHSAETIFVKPDTPPRTCLDTPVSGMSVSGKYLNVSGWSINNSGVSKINIYVDGVLKKTTTKLLSRPDVQKAYPEYTNSATSGFSENIDISDISNGIKTVKVEQVSNAGKTSEQVKINVVKPKPIICIDTPVSGRSVVGSSLTVSGWAISNTAIKSINIYVAGVLKKTTTKLLSRPDVQKAYPNYLNSDKSGFSENIDISNVAAGNRVIKIEQIGKDGSKTSAQIVVKINKLPAITCIDSPTEKLKVSGNKLNVSGWAISNTAIKSINIYVDGALKKTIVANLSRPDVQKAYPQYAYSKISGYSTDIDVTNIAKGNRKLKVEQVASDGSKHSVETIFVKPDTPPRTCLDTPVSGMSVSGKYLNVSGWSINNSGVSKINIYVDGALKKTTTKLLSRPDVQKAYPEYTNSATSGFSENIDISNVAAGQRIIKVEQVAGNGQKTSTQTIVKINKLSAITCIDMPTSNLNVSSSTLNVSGWAISNTEIKSINIYVDGVLKKTTTANLLRPDVQKAYPKYPYSKESGYSTDIDVTNIAKGQRTIKVEQVASDGSKHSTQIKINIVNKESKIELDTPADNSNVTTKSVTVKGWTWNPAGVKEVVVYVDGVKKSVTTANLSRPDVQKVYPDYTNSRNSGYSVDVDLNTIAPGRRTIKVVAIGKDNTQIFRTSTINVVKKKPISCIDAPTDNYIENSNTLVFTGWALNDSGVKNINVSIDGKKISTITATINRPDVLMFYPGYQKSSVCGFTTKLKLDGYTKGAHTVSVQAIGNDGSSHEISKIFYNKTKPSKVIVLDPGHNNGGDEGATAVVGNNTYYERLLNDAIALKTKSALEAKGYTVIFTRTPFAAEYTKVGESLANRVRIAENVKADLFISIHQNKFDKPSANGVEVYYSTRNSDSGYRGPSNINDKVNKSSNLARSVCNSIASAGHFTNRGAKDGNLFVCRNTSMPSILIECGFISSPSDVSKLSSSSGQSTIATAIANAVKAVIG